MKYSEHVGVNRQQGGIMGEMKIWYRRIGRIRRYFKRPTSPQPRPKAS